MFFSRLKEGLKYRFLKLIKPEIIGYHLNFQKKPVSNVRISNMAHISNRKNVDFGSDVLIFHFTYIDGFDKVTLADGCAIGGYTAVITHSAHNSLRLYGKNYGNFHGPQMKGLVSGPVSIGEYSFIGPYSLIMPGTTIGKGCIVSAYSMVSGNFGDYVVLKGNPAVVIGDTRQIDEAFLKRYPELMEFYYLGPHN